MIPALLPQYRKVLVAERNRLARGIVALGPGCKTYGRPGVEIPGSLGEEPGEQVLLVHRVLGVFEESFLSFRSQAVLVLLFGALGGDGVAGFLAGRLFLCSTVWRVSCSTHGVRMPASADSRDRVSPVAPGRSSQEVGLLTAVPAGAGGGVE